MLRVARIPLVLSLVVAIALLAPHVGAAAIVSVSGNVDYSGAYDTATRLYVVVYDTVSDSVIEVDSVAVAPPPFDVPFSVVFDNTGLPAVAILAAILDVDGSGYDPVELATPPDVVGWYASTYEPTAISTTVSQSGLDFTLPTGEIRGTVTFGAGQAEAYVEACSVPNSWCPQDDQLTASGPYAIRGLYAGAWIVSAENEHDIPVCWESDPYCSSPTVITLAEGEIRTGIDLDFGPVSVDAWTWGRVKAIYR